MTLQADVSQIAQRVLRAFEDPTPESLHRELGLAEQFACRTSAFACEEERSELLGAIAREMRAALELGAGGQGYGQAFGPHRQLLHHLSRPARRVN